MRVYLRQARNRRYCQVYCSASESPDDRPRVEYRPASEGLVEVARAQREERDRKRYRRKLIGSIRGGKRGRPRKYMDEKQLEAAGMYRRGDRVVTRKLPIPELCRRRWSMLAPEYQKLLSVDDLVTLERRVVSARKRANRLQQPWDANAAYADALSVIMASKNRGDHDEQ